MSIVAMVVVLAAVLVHFGLPVWGAILIAAGAVVINGWLLAFEDRKRGL